MALGALGIAKGGGGGGGCCGGRGGGPNAGPKGRSGGDECEFRGDRSGCMPPTERRECADGKGQGCIRREGTSETAPEAVRQAVGGGCQSGWGRLLSVTSAIEAGTWRQGGQWVGIGWPPWRIYQ